MRRDRTYRVACLCHNAQHPEPRWIIFEVEASSKALAILATGPGVLQDWTVTELQVDRIL